MVQVVDSKKEGRLAVEGKAHSMVRDDRAAFRGWRTTGGEHRRVHQAPQKHDAQNRSAALHSSQGCGTEPSQGSCPCLCSRLCVTPQKCCLILPRARASPEYSETLGRLSPLLRPCSSPASRDTSALSCVRCRCAFQAEPGNSPSESQCCRLSVAQYGGALRLPARTQVSLRWLQVATDTLLGIGILCSVVMLATYTLNVIQSKSLRLCRERQKRGRGDCK